MDKAISKISGLGVSGLVLVVAIEATGLAGAAAIAAALAAIGPGGMIGGIISLCAISLISQTIAEYGTEATIKGVINHLYENGESKESLLRKINNYPISSGLKAKLRVSIENH